MPSGGTGWKREGGEASRVKMFALLLPEWEKGGYHATPRMFYARAKRATPPTPNNTNSIVPSFPSALLWEQVV